MTTTLNPTSVTGLNYSTDPNILNYTNGLTVMSDSGMTPTSTTTATSPAYLLDGSLAQLSQPGSSSGSTATTATTSLLVPNLTVDSSFSIFNEVTNLTPNELQALAALDNGQLPAQTGASATQQSTSAANSQSTLLNALGDPIQWQIGDSELYTLDPSLATVVGAATSSAVTANPDAAVQSPASTQSVGGLIDTSA